MKKLIFGMLLAIISLSVYAGDVGYTPTEFSTQSEAVSPLSDMAVVPAIAIVGTPSVEILTVNVVNITCDMMPVCSDESTSVKGVPATKLITRLFTNNITGYRVNYITPPNNRKSWRLYGKSYSIRHTKLS